MISAKNITWYIECYHCYSYVRNTMGKTKELSVDLRQIFINFHKSVYSYSTISNQLAIPRSTVQSVIKKFKQFGTTENLPGCGRKPKLSPRTTRKLCHKVERHHQKFGYDGYQRKYSYNTTLFKQKWIVWKVTLTNFSSQTISHCCLV